MMQSPQEHIRRIEEEYLFECPAGPITFCEDWHKLKDAVTALQSKLEEARKVRPLEWSIVAMDDEGPTVLAAECAMANLAYWVEAFDDYWICSADENPVNYVGPDGFEKAKAAAQADYQRRYNAMSALIDPEGS